MKLICLEETENKYRFKYPDLYKTLCEDGMLNTRGYGLSWEEDIYPQLKEHPILLLYGKEIELCEEQDLGWRIESLKEAQQEGIITSKYLFIPFAHNGSGDMVCFCFDKKNKYDMSIVNWKHDDSYFIIEAKNIQDYIFKEMLWCIVDIEDDSLIADDLYNNINRMYLSHQKYLTERQQAIVKDIYSRSLKEYTYTYIHHFYKTEYEDEAQGLLTYDEFDEIIKQEIYFPLLNKKVTYMP